MNKEENAIITPEEALKFVEKELNIKLTGVKKKTNDLVFARTVFYYICREHLGISLARSGKMVMKDHATVLHSMNHILPQLKRMNPYAKLLLKIDKIFELNNDIEKADQYMQDAFRNTEAELKNVDLMKENKSLRRKILELETQLNLIPKNKEIFELLERIPKRKKEEAEERMVRSLRLVYNA